MSQSTRERNTSFMPYLNHFSYSILFCLLSLANSCIMEAGDAQIDMRNNSHSIIACYTADGLNSGFSYPDTILPATLNNYLLREHIDSFCHVYGRRAASYNDLLSTTQCGILSIFIFDQESIDIHGWPNILSESQYLVRYDLTGDDLLSLLGLITFPPDERMASMKMWPPYETVLKECAEREADSR